MPDTTFTKSWNELRERSLSAAELAELLDVSRQRVGQLEKERILVRGSDKQFPLVESVWAYIAFLAPTMRD
jgi:DNA-binding XRE family transcriptional regulator